MLEAVARNLWLLLTVVLPGLFTYGLWRMTMLLVRSHRLDPTQLVAIDGSLLATTAIVVAIALLQQTIAVAIESGLSVLATRMKRHWPRFHALICNRFALAASGRLDENGTRIVGNFFQTVNVSVGLALLLIYFVAYEALPARAWAPALLASALTITVVAAGFRMVNAMWAVQACTKGTSKSPDGGAPSDAPREARPRLASRRRRRGRGVRASHSIGRG